MMPGPQFAYACWCRDVPGSAPKRAQFAAAHLAHVEANVDRYMVAGPLKDGEVTVGSLLVVQADSVEDARNFLSADPYFAADIWESIDVESFMAVAGDWVGGIAWK